MRSIVSLSGIDSKDVSESKPHLAIIVSKIPIFLYEMLSKDPTTIEEILVFLEEYDKEDITMKKVMYSVKSHEKPSIIYNRTCSNIQRTLTSVDENGRKAVAWSIVFNGFSREFGRILDMLGIDETTDMTQDNMLKVDKYWAKYDLAQEDMVFTNVAQESDGCSGGIWEV